MTLRFGTLIFFVATLFLTVCAYAQDLTDGLIACYSFSGNATDGTANHYDGTVNNAALIADRFGNANSAYHFNGSSSSYISFPSNPFKIDNYSYSMWVNATSFPGAGTTGIVLSVGDVVTSRQTTINLGNLYSAGQFLGWGGGSWNDAPTPFTSSAAQGAVPNLNQWYHLVLTRSNTHIKLYINGQFIGSEVTNGYPAYYGTTTNAFIGVRCNYTQPYNGAIDDMSVYNREITQAEVTLLYQNGIACAPGIVMPNVVDVSICSSNSATLTATGGNQYRWYDAQSGGNFLFEGNPFTTPLLTSTKSYYVSNVDGSESGRRKVTVIVNSKPIVNCAYANMYYLPASSNISANVAQGNSPYTFTYTFGDGTQLQTGNSQVQHQYSQPGDYALKITVADINNCQSQCEATIKVAPQPPVSESHVICGPALTTLSASGGNTFRWYDAQVGGNLIFTGNPFTTPELSTSTDFFVSNFDVYESERVRVSVAVNPTPELICNPHPIYFSPNADISVELSSGTSPFSLNYDFGDGSSLTTSETSINHSYSEPGDYLLSIHVIDSKNCSAICDMPLEIITDIFIPNVITVNADSKNDYFNLYFRKDDTYIKYNGEEYFSLLVFDRWGYKMYQTNDPSVGWSGSGVADGVYYYLISIGSNDYRGWVTVRN